MVFFIFSFVLESKNEKKDCNCVHCNIETAFKYLQQLHPENVKDGKIIGENYNSNGPPVKCKYGKDILKIRNDQWIMAELYENLIKNK